MAAIVAVVLSLMGVNTLGRRALVAAGIFDPWRGGDSPGGSIPIESVGAPAPWQALKIPVGAFPAHKRYLPPLRALLDQLTGALVEERGLSAEVFIQGNHLHRKGGAAVMAAHGAAWIPIQGLGVWPGREPPRLWTWKDFVFLLPGMSPGELMYNVFRITGPGDARYQARDLMLGRGTVLEILLEGDLDAWLEKTRAVLLPPIKEPTFRSFPYYIPLLEIETLRSARPEQLEEWLGGASAYIRESREDHALLLLSRQPLIPVLERLGAGKVPGEQGAWRVPVERLLATGAPQR